MIVKDDNNELENVVKKLIQRVDILEKTVFGNSRSNGGDVHVPALDEGEKGILELIDNGFFTKPMKYKDIVKQLKTNATFLKNSSYKTILDLLVKEKRLQRKMVHHQWVYTNYG